VEDGRADDRPENGAVHVARDGYAGHAQLRMSG
jgi:hypothetical protein